MGISVITRDSILHKYNEILEGPISDDGPDLQSHSSVRETFPYTSYLFGVRILLYLCKTIWVTFN